MKKAGAKFAPPHPRLKIKNKNTETSNGSVLNPLIYQRVFTVVFYQQNIQMCTMIQSINYTFVRCGSILLLLLKIKQNLSIKPTLRYFSAQFMAQRSSLFRTCHIITDYIYSHTFWNRSNICYIELDHSK